VVASYSEDAEGEIGQIAQGRMMANVEMITQLE